MIYETLITQGGAAKIAAKHAVGEALVLKKIIIGDGGGQEVIPSVDQDSLVNPIIGEEFQLSGVHTVEEPFNRFSVSAIIPRDRGGWTIREVGILDEDGDLIVVANYPETFKPDDTAQVARELEIELIFQVSQADNVNIEVNNSDTLATIDELLYESRRPTLDGPRQLDEQTFSDYQITNYSFDIDYQVQSSQGNATISHDMIHFQSAAFSLGNPQVISLTANGNEYNYPVAIVALTVPLLSPPINYPLNDNDGNINVNWNVSPNAANYRLEMQKNSDPWQLLEGNILKTDYDVNNLDKGQYLFRVRAENSAGESAWVTGNETLTISLPPDGGIIKYASTSGESVLVDWSGFNRAQTYRLQIKDNALDWVDITSGLTTTQYTVNALEHAHTYYFRVRAENSAGFSDWVTGGVLNVGLDPDDVIFITGSYPGPTYNSESLILLWSPVARAVSYRVEQQIDNGGWTLLNTVSETQLNTPVLEHNHTYRFRIRAQNATGNSAWTTGDKFTVLIAPDVPATISYSNSINQSSTSIVWSVSSRATNYRLEKQENNGNWVLVDASINTTSHTVGGLNHDSNYLFRVRAEGAGGNSNWQTGTIAQVRILPAIPTSINYPSSDTDGSVTVNWSSSTNADNYTLQRKQGTGSWTTVNTLSGTSTSVSGLGSGSYKFRVRANNSAGSSTYREGTITLAVLLPPSKPTSITYPTSDNNGSITVSWSSSANAATYTLQRKKGSGSWSTLKTISSLSTTVSGLTDGSYKFQVRANNSSGSSLYREGSTTLVVTFPPGIPSSISYPASAFIFEPITVSWGAASGSNVKYELQEYGNAGGGGWHNLLNSTSARSYKVEYDFKGGFKFRVRAKNAGGVSSWREGTHTLLIGLGCFAIGTPVILEDGSSVPIETLSVGDYVKSYSVPGRIDESISNWFDWKSSTLDGGSDTSSVVIYAQEISYINYYLINGSLKVTYEHPLLAFRRSIWQWIMVKDLQLGDLLYGVDGNTVEITSITFVDEQISVIALDVDDVDCYFAGDISVLSHNAPIKEPY